MALHVLERVARRTQPVPSPTSIFLDHQVCKVGFQTAPTFHECGERAGGLLGGNGETR